MKRLPMTLNFMMEDLKSPVFTRTYKTDTVSPTISKITHPAKSDDSSLEELKKNCHLFQEQV